MEVLVQRFMGDIMYLQKYVAVKRTFKKLCAKIHNLKHYINFFQIYIDLNHEFNNQTL